MRCVQAYSVQWPVVQLQLVGSLRTGNIREVLWTGRLILQSRGSEPFITCNLAQSDTKNTQSKHMMGAKYLLALLPLLLVSVLGKKSEDPGLNSSKIPILTHWAVLFARWLSLWDAQFFMLHGDDIPWARLAGGQYYPSCIAASQHLSPDLLVFQLQVTGVFYQAEQDKKEL